MVFPLIVIPHHLHRCPGYTCGNVIQQHKPHVWRCFRPSCDDAPEYLCGLMADFLARQIETLNRARDEQKRRRMKKGGAF